MKNIFCILAVNSKDILIRNVESDLQRIKYKVNTKKGWVELRYKRKKVKKVTSKSTDLELFELDSCENFPSDSQPEEMIKLEETVDHDYATKSENIVPEFSCDKCNKKCVSKRGLTKHLKTKHGEETLELVVGSKVCALCNIFCKRNEIGEHMKKAHPESKIEFECDFCDARFSSKSKLERHRNIHKPKEEKFTCNLCGFETWSQDSLNRHMYRHYGSFN